MIGTGAVNLTGVSLRGAVLFSLLPVVWSMIPSVAPLMTFSHVFMVDTVRLLSTQLTGFPSNNHLVRLCI